MLLYLLFSNTAHFALTVFSAFVFFSASLLYFDSWLVEKKNKILLVRSIGFFIIALTQALHATSLNLAILTFALETGKIIGLTLILVSLIKEPILHPPGIKKAALLIPALPVLTYSFSPISAILFLMIAAVYYRKSAEGYEKQLKPAAAAFFFLGVAELISISFAWSDTSIVYWSKLLSQFGTVWNVRNLFEVIGTIILGLWIWGYIRFRLQIQIFVMTIALSVFIFVSTTVLFTFLLLSNLQKDALEHLKTDAAVMEYSLEGLKLQTLANARAVALDNSVKEAFEASDEASMYLLTSDYLISQGSSTLALVKQSGEVAMRAENKDATNDSVKEDPLFIAAIAGESVSTIFTSESVVAPEVFIKAAVPIRKGSDVIGIVETGIKIDNSFVDGIKSVTGLDTTIYGRDKRAATTLIAEDGKSRFIGTVETNKSIIEKVLGSGQTYIGSSQIFNQPYYVAYSPLKTYQGENVGMLSVAKPENTLTAAAQQSINMTFLGSIILMVISIVPAFFFSRFLKEQLEA